MNALRSTGSLYAVLFIGILVGLSGCENPGSVGSDLVEDRATVVIDTFSVNGISTSEFNWYSGAYPYFSAGEFNDPLFGSLRAIGMIKPELPPYSDSTFSENTVMKMRVIIDDDQTYGNINAPQQFDVYPISELWRGKAWKLKENIQFDSNQRVASFTIGEQDSIDVVLDPAWVETYREYAQDTTASADSAYKYEMFGLALVPTNSNKIIALSNTSTDFVIENPESDTIQVDAAQWAYSFDRGTPSIPQNSMPVHSTLESVLNFDLDLSEMNIQPVGLAKAELVLYQNEAAMESSIPATAARPDDITAQLYIVNPELTPQNIAPGSPVVTGTYSENDNAFHFEITSIIQRILIDGISESQRFYITFRNNGIIQSSLIYGEQAPADKSPKLIITSLKNDS